MTTGKLLPAAVVAHALGALLGVGRQWIDFLNDCRQDRTAGVFGERLYPIGHEGGDPERTASPRYLPDELSTFVKNVRAKSGLEKPFAMKIEVFTYDDSPGLEPALWRYRRVAPVTTSTAV